MAKRGERDLFESMEIVCRAGFVCDDAVYGLFCGGLRRAHGKRAFL